MSQLLSDISAALQGGKAKVVKELIEQALAEGMSAQTILQDGLMSGMDIIAVKFKNNEVYVPEVLLAARAMNTGTALLKEQLAESGAKPFAKAVLGTVKGDLHDIGKNLVRMMLEGKGIEVIDMGVDVHEDKFVEAVKAEKPDIVAMSALLTTTMGELGTVVEALKAANVRDDLIVMVGGAPVTDGYCKSIGADIYSPDAASAADAAKQAILDKTS